MIANIFDCVTHTSSLEDLSSRWPLGVEACAERNKVKSVPPFAVHLNDVIPERAGRAKRCWNEIRACPCGAVPTTTGPFGGHQSAARLGSMTRTGEHAQNPFI